MTSHQTRNRHRPGARDLAIVGGGLAGGLIALALARHRRDVNFVLIEAGETLGGNHRWSWFASDCSNEEAALVEPLRTRRWDEGYEVAFPAYRRELSTPYRSLSSRDFHAGLLRILPSDALRLGARATRLEPTRVTLESGEAIAARAVIDCRGFAPSEYLAGGWQIFVGKHWRLERPHGLERPIIMDARVEQRAPGASGAAYRFVYALPLGAQDIFVEDTYYANAPQLDEELVARRIDDYCAQRGWQGEEIGRERGVLPVIGGGELARHRAAMRPAGVALAGVRGGFAHPLTSYSFALAARTALAIARGEIGDGAALARRLDALALEHWRATRFYRALARMAFGAGDPALRYRIFERFYRFDERLIERFYAARSSVYDRMRILIGRPPVPMIAAARALIGTPPSLRIENIATRTAA